MKSINEPNELLREAFWGEGGLADRLWAKVVALENPLAFMAVLECALEEKERKLGYSDRTCIDVFPQVQGYIGDAGSVKNEHR